MFSGEAKKDQFPDAFIFEALKARASADDPLILVSDDKDFEAATRDTPHITRLKSIGALFDMLGFAIEAAQLVEAFFDGKTETAPAGSVIFFNSHAVTFPIEQRQ